MVGALPGGHRTGASCLVLALLVCAATGLHAQGVVKTSKPKPTFVKRPSVIVLGGYGMPLSHTSLTEFWNGGVSGSLQFLIPVQRYLSFGIGLDGNYLPFDEAAFQSRYGAEADSIPSSNMGLVSLSLISRVIIAPGYRFTPYVVAGLGASHVTGAVYKEKIAGVTQRYYDVPQKTRLSALLAVGVELAFSPSFAVEAEGRGVYIHNDDDLGLVAHLLAGVRFRL